jgi:uncharacterized membrane protein YkvA (DUF1232 family)
MAGQRNQNPNPAALVQVLRSLQLVWRLLCDSRVPFLTKLIIPAIIAYVVWPIDVIPDPIPILGQLDDLGVIFFGIRFFIEMCPTDIVMEHRRAIVGQASGGRGEYVDASYRVVGDDEPKS